MLSEVIANKVQHIVQKSMDNEAVSITLNVEVYPRSGVFVVEEVNEYGAEGGEIDG